MNYRIFVAKKEGFRIESESLLSELKTLLGLEGPEFITFKRQLETAKKSL